MISEFDLTLPIRNSTSIAEPFAGGSFGVSLPEEPALDALLSHIRLRWDPAWANYYRSANLSTQQSSAVLCAALGSTAFDIPMLFALFLLMSAKNGVRQRGVNLERLNRARLLAGRPALVEHVEVSMNLLSHRSEYPLNENGKIPLRRRLHHVRGHLARRGHRIFWRSPHLRGNPRIGVVQSRTIELAFH